MFFSCSSEIITPHPFSAPRDATSRRLPTRPSGPLERCRLSDQRSSRPPLLLRAFNDCLAFFGALPCAQFTFVTSDARTPGAMSPSLHDDRRELRPRLLGAGGDKRGEPRNRH